MQSLILLSIGATALGGAVALASLFHFFTERGSSRASDDLARRERALAEFYARANEELEAKRAALESLARHADAAANALGNALESATLALGARSSVSRAGASRVGAARVGASAPFKYDEFKESGRRASA